MSIGGSALPGIEAGRVEGWLAGHVDGLAGPVEFGLVSGGRSNLTYRLTDAEFYVMGFVEGLVLADSAAG
jgi:aminoglycoside phosphotransferase (APT) family kinase protein